MKIERISLYQVKLEFKKEFSASWGSFKERCPTLVQIESEGISGWGEAAALPHPYYTHEDSKTVFHVLSEYLCPLVLNAQPQSSDELNKILTRIKLNNIAKSGLEMAYWDLKAKTKGLPLYKLLGALNQEIKCGATLSANWKSEKLVQAVSDLLDQGYKKVRLKIKNDTKFSDLKSLVSKIDPQKIAFDANGCFTMQDQKFLKSLDSLGVLYIEQPIISEDLIANSQLQSMMTTPICLDESVYSFNQAQIACQLKSAKAFSIKSARMGGHSELLRVHDLALNNKISLVAGGMFESGIGRAHALAVAGLEGCKFPAALSESSYYYQRDIIDPAFSFGKPGIISLSDRAGIGVEPDLEYIKKICVFSRSY